jgi:ATP-dependent helicase/nuclease subunit B
MIFHDMEMDDAVGEPLLLEYGFGVACESAGPLSIELPSGLTFHLSGRIDRIDRIGRDAFRVLDYKTGGSERYDGQWYFMRGRRIQHALYSIAAESIIEKLGIGTRPSVKEAGYVFPTMRGEGRRVLREQGRKAELLELLDLVFDVMRDGTFLAAEDGGFCGICDYYDDVCGDEAARHARRKLETDKEGVLRTISEITAYE